MSSSVRSSTPMSNWCSLHVSPLSLLNTISSLSFPRIEPKWGISTITGLKHKMFPVKWIWMESKMEVLSTKRPRSFLTQGTEPQQVQPLSGDWPGLLPPPWVGGKLIYVFWPNDRWCEWVQCTSWEVWWYAYRCDGFLSWNRHGHPPWSWPRTCTVLENGVRKEENGTTKTDRNHNTDTSGEDEADAVITKSPNKERKKRENKDKEQDRCFQMSSKTYQFSPSLWLILEH